MVSRMGVPAGTDEGPGGGGGGSDARPAPRAQALSKAAHTRITRHSPKQMAHWKEVDIDLAGPRVFISLSSFRPDVTRKRK